MDKGKIYFVGAGAGDFELLTLKGKRYIENADCIIYDRLINDKILSFAKPSAELIYLGKENTEGGLLQERINQTLVEKAISGKYKNIVRLKGGDSFVFGRGGEEIEAILPHNIPFEMVPGISSSIAVPEYAGIPVTHRKIARSFHVFTGMTADDDSLDFETIAKLQGTLVFLMGVKNLETITKSLIKYGKNPETPIGIIERGCEARQNTTIGTLENIMTKAQGIKPPAIIIVGEVVEKRELYKWFEDKPLFGKKVVVTREAREGYKFGSQIERLGGKAISLPMIDLIDDMMDFDYKELKNYQGIMFNSPNGVKFFFEHIDDIRSIAHLKIGAIGSKTSQELKKYKITPDVMPSEYLSENLAFEMTKVTSEGDKIFIMTSDVSPIDEASFSKKYKREFKKYIGYKNIPCNTTKENIIDTIKGATHITFFSGSSAENFFKILEDDSLLEGIKIISIGPSTTRKIREFSQIPVIECKVYTGDEILKNLEIF